MIIITYYYCAFIVRHCLIIKHHLETVSNCELRTCMLKVQSQLPAQETGLEPVHSVVQTQG